MPENILLENIKKENIEKLKILQNNTPHSLILKTITYILDEVIQIRKKVIKIEERLK